MSLIGDAVGDAGTDSGHEPDNGIRANSNFWFVPKELAVKCRRLIESYHGMHGYGCLPDMLWHSDARDLIECHRDLDRIFKNASKSRCAKRANESLLLIATVIGSLELLARDFAGWGQRFPAAKREAERLLADFTQRQRVSLMDMYLHPRLSVHRDLAGALAPSAPAKQMTARN